MNPDIDRLRGHALEYLLGAGWASEDDPPRGGVAMRHVSGERTLVLRHDPADGFVRLGIAFRGAASPGWLFRDGAIELRIYVQGPAMLGLLCRITSSQAELGPDEAAEWIEAVVSVFPDTYAVIAKTGLDDLLVQVMPPGDARVLH